MNFSECALFLQCNVLDNQQNWPLKWSLAKKKKTLHKNKTVQRLFYLNKWKCSVFQWNMAVWALCWHNGNNMREHTECNLTATRLAFEAFNSWNLKWPQARYKLYMSNTNSMWQRSKPSKTCAENAGSQPKVMELSCFVLSSLVRMRKLKCCPGLWRGSQTDTVMHGCLHLKDTAPVSTK